MPAITLTVTARQDLLGIWEYIATDNVAAADRVLDTLDARMQLLADHPLLGPARPDIAPDFRYLVSGNYLILYRILPEAVEIVRVLQGARNLTAIFTDIDPLSQRLSPLKPVGWLVPSRGYFQNLDNLVAIAHQYAWQHRPSPIPSFLHPCHIS